MLKKTTSIFLSIILLLSLCSTAVFGAMPTTVLVPAEGVIAADATGMAVDNFDDKEITETAFKRYNRNGDLSDLFYEWNVKEGVSYRIISADNAADSADKVLEISNHTADGARLDTLKFTVAENYVTELSFDVRFTAVPTSTTLNALSKFWVFGFSDKGGGIRMDYDSTASAWKLWSPGQGAGAGVEFVEADKLYTVQVVVDGTTGNRQTYLLDAASGAKLVSADLIKCGYTDGIAANTQMSIMAVQLYRKVDGDSDVKLEIDNAKMVRYNRTVSAPAILSSSIANGAAEIDIKTNMIEVKFDQSIKTAAATLKAADGTEITSTVASVKNKLNTYTISWEDILAEETTYTLDMSATVNTADVQAGEDAKITFKTTEPGIEKIIEDFETGTTKGSQFKGDVLQLQYSSRDGVATLDDNGYTGKALKIEIPAGAKENALDPLATKTSYQPKAIAEDEVGNKEYEKFVVTYRFNLKDMADVGTAALADVDSKTGDAITRGSRINMAIDNSTSQQFNSLAARISTKNSKPVIHNPGDDDFVEFSEDHWYNIVWLVDGTEQTFNFVDSETGKLIWKRTFNSESYTAGEALYVVPYGGRRMASTSTLEDGSKVNYIYNEGQTVLIDDFTIWRVDTYKNKQKLALTDSNDGAVLNIDDNDTITMTYNQPVLGVPTNFEVYKVTVDDENVNAYSTASIKYKDFCTQEISLSNLDYLGEYALDYSAMTAVSGAELTDAAKPTSIIEFSTAASSDAMSVIGDVICTGLAEGSTISFDLYSKEATSGAVVAAFYNRTGRLLGIEPQTVNVAAGINDSVTVTLNKNQVADYIKLFIWDGFGTCVPVAKTYELHAPKDSLDVLLIGSSISEDAGRYMHQVAAADNFDLNVTVKGIGGSNFTHHAANVRAELAGRTIEEAIEQNADNGNKLTYWTYVNGEYLGGHQRLIDALQEKQYDVVSLNQAAYHDPDVQEDITFLTETIRQYQPNAEIVFYQTWAPYNSSTSQRSYYYTNTVEPQVISWAAATGANAQNVTKGGAPVKIFPAGKAFYLADNKYEWCGKRYTYDEGDTESDAKYDVATKMQGSQGLWRDYNHASWYGCYLADAVWYEMLTGRKAQIGTDENPAVPKPDGIDIADHMERLSQLSDLAHQAVLEQKN
ncbi:MAG: hypothetical protein IKW59_03695 [Clostridia bacterium]|nr:hypothetical protein [Clostridia bacterium]